MKSGSGPTSTREKLVYLIQSSTGHCGEGETETSLLWGRAETLLPGGKKAQGILSMCTNIVQGRVHKTEPGSSQQCPVTRPEALGMNWNRRFPLSIRRQVFTDTGCPGRLWSHSLDIRPCGYGPRQPALHGPACLGGKTASWGPWLPQPLCDCVKKLYVEAGNILQMWTTMHFKYSYNLSTMFSPKPYGKKKVIHIMDKNDIKKYSVSYWCIYSNPTILLLLILNNR